MMLVLAMAVALWGLGHVMRAPAAARLYMIGLLLVAVLCLHLVLPDGHPLRMATGETAAPWALLLGLAGLVGLYRFGLGKLRDRAQPIEPDAPRAGFSEAELDRYARHIVLREIGGPGQARLAKARVLVVGAGGLGAPALLYLSGAGVGTIGVIDGDSVDNANLQRQVIFRDGDIGMPKVFAAQHAMEALNPYVAVRPYHRVLSADIAEDLIADYDVILDGTDDYATRALVNRIAVLQGKPLVSGALSQWEGQLSVFDPAQGAPCYACLFPEEPAAGLAPSCAEAGVLGPLPGVIGSMMAVEAVKLIADAGAPFRGSMLIYDALWGETRKVAVTRRANCAVCGTSQG